MPRRELDFYETPPHYIAALFGEVRIEGCVFEPCVGEGTIADALRKLPKVRVVDTNDIDEDREADYHFDASKKWVTLPYDWCVTNPPFSQELEILQNMFEYVPNIALLARLSFLEPTEDRAEFLERHPPTRIITLPRYSFRPNDAGKRQTDSVTCAWLVWSETTYGVSVWGRGRSQAQAILMGLA